MAVMESPAANAGQTRPDKALVFDNAPMAFYIESPMRDTLTVTQGQAQFPALCRKDKTTAITKNGEVVSFVVPRQKMADLLEQMEILSNPAAMAAISKAKSGKGTYHPLSILDKK